MAVATIDLIPAAYREECRARSALKWFIPLLLVLIATIAGIRYKVHLEQVATTQELESLRSDISFNAEQQQRFDTLSATRNRLDERARVLDGLRGGLRAERLFAAIDAAASEDIWFRRWTFQRHGEVVNTTPATAASGYMIILAPGDNGEAERAWRLDTHMEISGSALNHSAIAAFVERLLERPEISDARILRTGSRRDERGEIIDFELAISLHADEAYTS